MSLLSPDVIRNCARLTHEANQHSFDITKAGGAFGDDNFGRTVATNAETIALHAHAIAALIEGKSPPKHPNRFTLGDRP